MDMSDADAMICPTPLFQDQFIVLGHGSGGKLTANLVEQVFLPFLNNEHLGLLEDAADLDLLKGRCVVTTDSYVVQPIFFPGGDIGSLAVHGTINDLAVRGAIPKYLTAGFILEEGFAISELKRLVFSMAQAAKAAGVTIVAADTKVVNRGAADKIFINTCGIGELFIEPPPSVSRVKPGDVIIVSGDLGRHGIAIMCQRSGLELETTIESDCCALSGLVSLMLSTASSVSCMRDLTRGGLATVLNEIAASVNVGIHLQENLLPVCEQVRGACELLGLDPMYVACEGRLVVFCPEDVADKLIEAMRTHPDGSGAAVIGRVTDEHPRRVVMQSMIGGRRLVDKLAGEQLPRIC